MNDPIEFESALERLAEAVKDVFRELHAAAPAPPAAPVVVQAPPPPPAAPAAPVGPGTAPLCAGFENILTAGSQTEVMQALLACAEVYASRSALLVAKGDRLACWRSRGFDEAAHAAWRTLEVPADGENGWRQGLSAKGALPAAAAGSFFQTVGWSHDGNAYLVPVLVRDRAVAMLYGDAGTSGSVDACVLHLLARTSGLRLEMSAGGPARPAAPAPVAAPPPPPPPTFAPPPPAPTPSYAPPPPPPMPPPVAAAPAPTPMRMARPSGPDLTNIPAADQEIHKKAFRFAKLLVDELMLYNKDKVAQGKQQRDVYSLLQEDIDKSRLAYEKKFANTSAAKVDYFHQQMVSQIGDGDVHAIGSGYPGALV